MKITKEVLEKIIKEEVENILSEREDSVTAVGKFQVSIVLGKTSARDQQGGDTAEAAYCSLKLFRPGETKPVAASNSSARTEKEAIAQAFHTFADFQVERIAHAGNFMPPPAAQADAGQQAPKAKDVIDTASEKAQAVMKKAGQQKQTQQLTFGQANKAALKKSGGKPTTFMFDRDGSGKPKRYKTW